MLVKNFTTAIILILCAAASFGQNKKSTDDDYLEQERRQREHQERLEEAKQAETILAAQKEAEFPDLKFFLPVAENSWTISIAATGGFFGGTRLLAAVNSDGNFLCFPKDTDFKDKFVSKEIFQSIANIAAADFSKLNLLEAKQPPKKISFCSDCAVETLTISRRSEKGAEDFHFHVADLEASANLNQLYEKVLNSAECK
ncbi:MAG: hypothetical protein H0U87_06235 [Acidobacteria bacterium]|nr:hypothetical protein [Acidobacteriota bacterium]